LCCAACMSLLFYIYIWQYLKKGTYVGPDLGSCLFAAVQSTDASVFRLKWVMSVLFTCFVFSPDRQVMLIRDNNHFMSMRQNAKMALITVNITDSDIVLKAPGVDSLKLSKVPNKHATVQHCRYSHKCLKRSYEIS